MKLLMLNGICEGQMYEWDDAPPTWKIAAPASIRTDSFSSPTFDPTLKYDNKRVFEYKKAFISLDGEMALYTYDGSYHAMIDGRDWIQPAGKAWFKRHTVHWMGRPSISSPTKEGESND